MKHLNFGRYDNCLNYIDENGNKRTVDKVKVAREVVEHTANLEILDLKTKIHKLISFIHEANGI